MAQAGARKLLLPLLLVFTFFGFKGGAQDYPFRDPKLGDDARIADLLARLTLQEKIDLMGSGPKVPRLHLALSDEAEGLHGLALGGPGNWGPRGRQPLPTTIFPQEKGLGATWDPALMKKIGALEGEEARYYHQNPVFDFGGIVVRAPNADLSRDPRWGRTEESMGEDPYLVGAMTVAFIHGLQGPDRPSSRELARQATDESIVLLKNDNHALPLDRAKLKTIALIGPWTNEVLLDWYSGTAPYSVSILQGITEAAPAVKILFSDGSNVAEAESLARKADVAVVIVGNHPTCNAGWDHCPVPSDGKEDVDRKTIVLEQEELVKRIFAANPHTIEVLRSSFPYAIAWSQQNLPAILHMTHNSEEEGHGLADVLFGDYLPAGRLTQTWPTGDAQLLPMMDYDIRHGRTYMYAKEKPLYPFGYGLSYTTFAYEGLTLSAPAVNADGGVQINVRVRNTGKRAGDEVIQIYVQHLGSAVERPRLELKGFERVHIEPGAARNVILNLKPHDLAYWDETHHSWRVEKESVRILAGGSSDKLPVQAILRIDTDDEYKP